MILTIHRGTKEIGGSCVEISTDKTRILIDFGMPLVERDGSEFDFKKYKIDSIEDLIKKKVLFDIKGLYENSKDILLDGLLISHPHIDHYGFARFVNKDIPVYLGKTTKDIIKLTSVFTFQPYEITKYRYFEKNKSFFIGDIKVTPYYNDHSANDSYGFLIEGDGKSIYYSGDFRAHGWEKTIFESFLNNPPKNVDCLLMEGTTISRFIKKDKSEADIERELLDLFKQIKINLIYSSGQNIDRIIAVYEACKKAGKTLLIDFYIANVLRVISYNNDIPYPSKKYPEIKVFYPYKLSKRISDSGNEKYLYAFQKFKITKQEINNNPEKFVMFVRPTMRKDLDILDKIDGGNFIYSLWEGYLSKKNTSDFVNYMKDRKFTIHKIHTSGHADTETLKKMVDAIKPKLLIPIHTSEPQKYKENYNVLVMELKDGISYQII